MKTLLLMTALVLSFSTMAKGDGWKKNRDFRVGQIGKRISLLQTAQSCFKSADSREAFKACRKARKASAETLKDENQAHKATKKAKRAERKAKKGKKSK